MAHIAINAHLLAPGNGYRRAGIHNYIYHLLHHLPEADEAFHYTVLLNHPEESLSGIEQRVGLNTDQPWKRILWEQYAQPLVLRQIKPALYHATAFVMPRGLTSPSVVTIHDLSFVHYPEALSRLRRRYLQIFTRASCERATRVIAVSESTARDLVEVWDIPREKIDVTLEGVSPEFRPLPQDEIDAFRDQMQLPRRFLFFLGTLEPRKNLPMLIRAYQQLSTDMQEEVHLVLGGGRGWMYEDIFATIGNHPTIHTPGFIPADELVWWYNAAEAFVYPTLYEGFGIPVLEAMACGKPTLVSNSSSLPEVAGDVGKLLPPDDEAAWTQALESVIYAGQAFDHKAQQWAARFTWQRTAQQTVESYKRAL